MESVENIKNDDMPLSLISKLCDSRLKELSVASYSPDGGGSITNCSVIDFQDSASLHASLYSNVLHANTEETMGDKRSIVDECENYSIEIEDADGQQLQICRNVGVSRHIKSLSTQEYLAGFETQAQEEETVDYLELFEEDNENGRSPRYRAKRLESFLPILKHRVQTGRWAKLKGYDSLQDVAYDYNSKNTNDYFKGCSNPQEMYIAVLKHLKVFYGLIDKPNSLKSSRLNKLFNKIGAYASVPLLSVTNVRKQLFIQDGGARLEIKDLSGQLRYGKIVSNVPVALIGKVSGTQILVEDVVFATPEYPEWPMARQTNIEMIFVSGLYIGSDDISHTSLDLLQDYILGLSGSSYEQSQILASRARVCFVGNLMSKSLGRKPPDFEYKVGVYTRNMEQLDTFLEPIVRLAEVFVVPGDNDLTLTPALPQPPMHPKLFSESGKYPTLKRLTNPARIQLSTSSAEGRSEQSQISNPECSWMDNSFAELLKEDAELLDMVLQSGSSVKHNMDHCDISCPVEMGRKLLEWGHLHPLSDNLTESAQNIFSLKGSMPHLMVIGNVSEFKLIEYNGTKIIGVPSFRKTNTAVVLTKDFNVIPISFRLY